MAVKSWVNNEGLSASDLNTYGANHHMKMLYEATGTASQFWTGSVFTSEFDNYFISISNATVVTAQKTLLGRFTFGGSSANQIAGTSYSLAVSTIDATGGTANGGAVNQSAFRAGELSMQTASPSAFQMMVYRPALASNKGVNSKGWGPSAAVYWQYYNYANNASTSTVCDGILFYNDSFYNMTLTIRIYGMRQT